MIIINEDFQFKKCERGGWELNRTYTGTDKNGNPKKHKKVTYHADIHQLCSWVINEESGKYSDFKELLDALQAFKFKLCLDVQELIK